MLPYGKQCIEEDDIAAVVEVLRGEYLTTGPKVSEFEAAFTEVTQSKHAVVCANGTAALHLAVLALELGPGDAAIVPSLTFLATANAIRYAGAEVVFSDVDPETGLMRPEDLEEALVRCGNLNPKAVLPVHLAGQCVDLKPLAGLAKARGLYVISDSCHAVGSTYRDSPVGSCKYEDISVFSFHPVKTIAMGEGGAITTNDDTFAERMRRLRSHGMISRKKVAPWYYEMPELGYNYRATDMQCALGLSQLKKLKRFVARRKELAALYDRLLKGLSPKIMPPEKVPFCSPAWHLYAPRFDFDNIQMDRATLMNKLFDRDIGTQVHYIPVHRQPYYTERYGMTELQGVDHFYRHTLSLPLFPAMTDGDVMKVVDALFDICQVGT